MKGGRKLVLFDFDGTITNKDTLFTFTCYAVGVKRFYTGLLFLSAPLVLQKLKLLSAQKAKEIFLSYFFKDTLLKDFDKICQEFSRKILPNNIRPQALSAIKLWQEQKSQIVIVSASPTNWILPWAYTHGIEVIATQLESKDGKLSGKISGGNCNGLEKVNRIKARFNLKDFSEIIAYGDSVGDQPMIQLASKQFYKPFRK